MKNKISKFINLQGKYLTSLLIALVLGIGQMWGTTFTYSGSSGYDAATGSGATRDNITIVFSGGSHSNSSGGYWNVSAQNTTVTITSTTANIMSVAITHTDGSRSKQMSVQTGSGSISGTAGTDAILTYSHSSAEKNIVLKYTQSGARVTSIEVTTSGGGGGSSTTTYTVTYDGNGATSGNVPTDSNSPYAANAEVTVLGNTGSLAKTSFTFSGWNTKADGTGTSYSAGDKFNIGTADVTLYAKWTINLTTHTPGTYTKEAVSGGYGKTLKRVNGRDYEVYMFKTATLYAGSSLVVTDGKEMLTAEASKISVTEDGWLAIKPSAVNAGGGAIQSAEFSVTTETTDDQKTHYQSINNASFFTFKISGYDQFSFVGRDADSKDNKFFVVKIDGVVQEHAASKNDNTIYRHNISTGTHTIEISGGTSDANRLRGFSLRLPAYSVTYEENGHGDNQTDLTEQTNLPNPLPTLSANGWVFGGWFLDNNTFNTQATAGAALTANTTLYAKWTEAAPVATPTITAAVNEAGWGSVSPASITVTENSTIALNDNVLTCDGKTLTATASAATAQYTYAFSNWSGVANNDAVTNDIEVTANFTRTPVNYTLAWNSNGGSELSGTYTSGTVAYGAEITKPADPTREGYKFGGWAESTDGEAVEVPATMPASNKTYYAKWNEIVCPTEGVVFSLVMKTGLSNYSLPAATEKNLVEEGYATISGGTAVLRNNHASDGGKARIDNSDVYFGGAAGYLKVVLDCPLQINDVIAFTNGTEDKQICFTLDANRATTYATSDKSFKVTSAFLNDNDNVKTFYVWRASGDGTHLHSLTITRPEKFTVTYWKNDGTDAKTVDDAAATIATNTFSRTGYRFIEWNTQADGQGSAVAASTAVTEDKEVFAIWAAEYTVSYAATGAASGDAPTNANKYLQGETFKVAGVGTMIAATDYVFAGWNDGTNTYQEDDDYTVGTANVSFAPVWNQTFNVYYYPNGGSGTAYTAVDVTKVNECFFAPAEGKLFDKWTTHEDGTGNVYAPGATVTASINLYAQWKDDECTNRKSLIEVTFSGDKGATAATDGYNEKEYAGGALINKLGDNNGPVNGGYKIHGDGGYVFATIAKGDFQEGDKLEIEITQVPGSQKLDVYAYGDDIATAYKVVSIEQVSAAGTYSYALTAANATAINTLGYKSLGIYRAATSNMNPYVKSVKITGCRNWVVKHAVTFNLNGQEGSVAPQLIAEGGLVTKPADPAVDGQFFRGWYKEAACTNAWDFANDVVGNSDVVLYAKWEADPCTDRKSLSKVVLTEEDDGTVTGYNNDEYAGNAIINNLGGKNGSQDYDFGDGSVTGYKLAGSKSTLMATLAKGEFQEGDKVIIAVAKKADGNKLEIYAASDKDNAMLVKELDATAAGIYTYTLTEADATAINNAGYKSIGTYRGSYNPFVYSVEITGCRTWSVYHTLTFKNIDGTATIDAPLLAEGAYASTVAPAAPVVADKFCTGWSESIDGTPVDMSAYTITEDKVLYAVYDDCPTYGTIFKLAIKTGLDNGNVFGTTPNSMELTTENYLAELENGSVTAAVSGSDNNRIQYYDGKGLGFYSGNQGSLTITLDCPMKTGDVIRYINYAASNNKLKLSSNSKDVQADGNGAETIQTIDVPTEWNNQRTLVLSRGNNTPTFTYFEIYRRPVLTGIEMADMTMRVNQALAPQVTLLPEGALVTSQSWEITGREGAANAQINNTTGVISAGSETGTLTVKATFNGDKVATCTVTIINVYESLVPVTGTTNWNWAGAASSETKINDVANLGLILGNYINGANFDKLEGVENERAYRSNSYPGYQGTQLHFVTTVPGMLTVNARNSASGQRLFVNSKEVTSADLTDSPVGYSIVVPTGDVYITSTGGEIRIYSMKFDTDLAAYELTDNVLNGYTRNIAEGEYGTICLPKAGVMVGASLFEVAYFGQTSKKIFFDEIINGEMEAGKPYIFQLKEGESDFKVFYTNTVEAVAGAEGTYFTNGTTPAYASANGLIGYIGTDDYYQVPAGEDYYIIYNNQYHFVQAGADARIVSTRACIKMNDINPVETALAPGRRRVSMGGEAPQVTTGVEGLNVGDQPVKVIINGQLFILRGEKMYNANGQLVK